MNSYQFKRSFVEDASLSDRLFNLLDTVFPGIGLSQRAALVRKLGAPWEGASTPFMHFEENLAIAHVGVLEIPLRIMGKNLTVGGIHGVCTRPEYRRKGYYRSLMQEALNYCTNRYQTLVLTTSQPELYEPFGFRVVGEHAFKTQPESAGYMDAFRRLNLSKTEDIQLLNRLLETRQPVSNIVGVFPEKALFCVNEVNEPLYYAADLDLIVSMEIKDTQLNLYDLVGKKICTLADILARIPQPIEAVTIYFSPDLLDTKVKAFPHMLDGDSFLMVRGEFAAEAEKFMLPRSARC
jgi:predicted N-acetyltransferase YhbS